MTMARQFFEGQQGSTTPALTVPLQVHHSAFTPLHDLSARPTFHQAWAKESQQVAHRHSPMNGLWASEFNGTQLQAGPGPSIQRSAQQVPEGKSCLQ